MNKTPYVLSDNYKRLKELLDEGYEIACYAIDNSKIQKTVICVANKKDDNYYSVAQDREATLLSLTREDEGFEAFSNDMKKINLFFIQP